MYKPLQFAPEIEQGVRFVEETPPEHLVRETVQRLQQGTPAVDLVRAAALAVVRSTELPAGHHGGAVHPISATHGCLHTARRLSGTMACLPVVQYVAVCNHHIHSPQMGPYIMPELTPRDGSLDQAFEVFHDIESSVVHLGTRDLPSTRADEQLQSTVLAFINSIEGRRPVAAEQCLLWLLAHESPGEVLDHLLPLCIRRNHLDDHNFLYPVLSAIALEDIGWAWAGVLLRPVVRYHARAPSDIAEHAFDVGERIDQIMHEYDLAERTLALQTDDTETGRVTALAEQMTDSPRFLDNVEISARALIDGVSLEGVGEAMSVAASNVFTRSEYGNPMDSHLHTGATTRRFLLRLPGVSQRTRVMALLSGLTGPECTPTRDQVVARPAPASRQAAGSGRTLLEAVVEVIETQPGTDWRQSERIDQLVSPAAARDAMDLTAHYIDAGGDATRLLDALGALVSRDDFTELHSIKQHQTLVDEYHATRESLRDVHLLAAARSTACIRVGREQTVYEEMLTVAQ